MRSNYCFIPPSHRRRGATMVFGENRHHRSDTASSFSWFFPYPSHLFKAVEPSRDGSPVYFSRLHGGFIPRHTGGAVPLRFLIKTAITVLTPPVMFNSFRLPVTQVTAVEPPRDRSRVASLHFSRLHGGCTADARR